MPTPSAQKLHEEGVNRFRNGDAEGALEKLQAALAQVDSGSRQEAEIYNDLGVVYRDLEDYEAGHQALEQAMTGFTALDDEKGQAQTLGNLAALLEAEGELEEAVETYKESAELFEALGESDMAMYVWQAISRLRTRQGQYIAAIGAYEEGVQNMPAGSFKRKVLQKILRAPGAMLGQNTAPPDDDDEDDKEDK